MVNVDYEETIFSFKKGIKYSKAFYYSLISIYCVLFLVILILLIVKILSGEDGKDFESIYGLAILDVLFLIIALYFIALKLYENNVIKVSILKCIKAEDAILRKVFIFEVGSDSLFMTRKRSKIGVRFTYGNKKVLMVSKKYAVLRDYIDKECRIVYSASCDDVVLLKAEKTKRTCKEK